MTSPAPRRHRASPRRPRRADAVEIERRIDASPATVFAFFTDPALYRQWQGVDAELDPRVGGAFRLTMTGTSRQVVRGVYLEVDPPRRLVYSWGWDADDTLDRAQSDVPPGSSTVEVTLAPDGGGTLLRLRHSGLPHDLAHRFHDWGWNLTLDRVVVLAEGGTLDENPFREL